MSKGIGNGAGRPPGSTNKEVSKREREVNKIIDEYAGGITPLAALAKIYSTSLDPELVVSAAGKAAPYVHKKMPMEHQHTGEIEMTYPPMLSRAEMAKLIEHPEIEGESEEVSE